MSINQSSACRRLFQSNDDENDADQMAESNQNFANNFIEELKRQRNEMTRKYNFDFENEVPLEGNYVWEPIETQPSHPNPPVQTIPQQSDSNKTEMSSQDPQSTPVKDAPPEKTQHGSD